MSTFLRTDVGAWLRAQCTLWLRHRGFVPVAERDLANASVMRVETDLAQVQTELRESKTFICEGLQPLTQLAPVVIWPAQLQEAGWLPRGLGDFEQAHARAMEVVTGQRRIVVLRVILPAALNYYELVGDWRALDTALRFIGQAAAWHITQDLRFGLTGSKKAPR